MPIDINEARGIVEDARKRGLIHSPGDAPVQLESKKGVVSDSVLPDWLQESFARPSPHK